MAYSVTTEKTWARILDDIEDSLAKWRGVTAWKVELDPGAAQLDQAKPERPRAHGHIALDEEESRLPDPDESPAPGSR